MCAMPGMRHIVYTLLYIAQLQVFAFIFATTIHCLVLSTIACSRALQLIILNIASVRIVDTHD